MSVALRSIVLATTACTLAALSGCGSSSYGSTAGASNLATNSGGASSTGGASTGGFNSGGGMITGTHNSIVATPESNLVSVQVGQKQTVAVTFTSSDGRSIQGFGLTSTTLPPGWTGPSPFGCAVVNSGSSCVLNLVYSPTAFETGKSVTLSYLYVDNSGTSVTNGMSGASISMSFNYQATTDDNVLSVVAPAGQIVATTNSGSQPFTVTFTTDDGHPATNLMISPMTLPASFTPPSPAGCAALSDGMTTCALTWLYQPTVPENGTLTFAYTYADDSGTAKTGTFNVAYQAMANNSVTYTVDSVTNPVLVTSGGSQPVTVTFVTDDGYPASNLGTDLSALGTTGPNWSTTGATCAVVDVGTGCQMTLTYSPTMAGEVGTVQVPFSYINNAGVARSATVNIPYASN